MVDVTGFAKLIQPQIPDVGRSIQAGAIGQEMRQSRQLHDIAMQGEQMKLDEMRLRQAKSMGAENLVKQAIELKRGGDRQGFNSTIADLYATNPKVAKETYDFFGTIDQQNLVDSAYSLMGATSLPVNDLEGRKQFLAQAKDNLENPAHPISLRYDEMLAETDPTKLNAMMLENMAYAQKMGLFPAGKAGKSPEEIAEIRAKTGKLEAETLKILKEISTLGDKGDLTTDKKVDLEQKLADKYFSRTKNFQEVNTTFNNLMASAEQKNGPGDLALITTFMKMLDPGSVVRETEFANAQDTAGLWNRLKNMAAKWKEGDLLQPEDRLKFTNLARAYLEGYKKEDTKVRDQIDKTINAYGLNRDIVLPAEEKLPEKQAATPAPAAGQTAPAQDYTQMSSTDIMQNLVKSMGQ